MVAVYRFSQTALHSPAGRECLGAWMVTDSPAFRERDHSYTSSLQCRQCCLLHPGTSRKPQTQESHHLVILAVLVGAVYRLGVPSSGKVLSPE